MLMSLIIVAASILVIITVYLVRKEKTIKSRKTIKKLDLMLEKLVEDNLINKEDVFYTSFKSRINMMLNMLPKIKKVTDTINFKKRSLLHLHADKILKSLAPSHIIVNYNEHMSKPQVKEFSDKYKEEYPKLVIEIKKSLK